jgi:hypothetical protein
MKKFFIRSIKLIILATIINFSSTTSSAKIIENQEIMYVLDNLNNKEFVQEQTQRIIEENNINTNEVNKYTELFNDSKKSGYLYVDENGHLIVKDFMNESTSDDVYNQFLEDIKAINAYVDMGIITVDTVTLELNYCKTGDYILKIEPLNEEDIHIHSHDLADSNTSLSSSHSCSLTKCNLGNLVHNNYNSLKDYFDILIKYNPEWAYAYAVSYWVDRVQERGAWDYKVQPGYSPWYKELCCSYGYNNSKVLHLTSEFIGNYNYGYTGRFLFSIDTLYFGSYIASGLNDADVSDHPSIWEGYNDCGTIEW